MTRDDMCIALSNLYGWNPTDFDGMTLAEISEYISLEQLDEVCDYLGIAA